MDHTFNKPSTQIIILRGLPGSGKSTYAQELLTKMNETGLNVVRINKDMLRGMLQDHKFHGSDDAVNAAMYAMTRTYLEKGISVISDNMNLDPKHLEAFKEIMWQVNDGQFQGRNGRVHVVMNVTDIETPTEECIARDFHRAMRNPQAHVGEDTIRHLDDKFRKNETANGFPKLPMYILNWTRMS